METVPVNQELLAAINDYVKDHLAEWIAEAQASSTDAGDAGREPPSFLSERLIRVEEGIKRQGEVLEKLMLQIERRFEEQKAYTIVRFEQVDRRFEELRAETNRRFDEQRAETNRRFEDLMRSMDKRFNQNFRFVTVGIAALGLLATAYKFWVA